MKTAKLKCGCQFTLGDVERWTELCPPHKAEADAIHAQWAEQHRNTPPLPPRQELPARNTIRIGSQP